MANDDTHARSVEEMSTARFSVSYAGSAVDDGAIDVHTLIPALAGIGKIITQTNKVLNGDRAQVSVKVIATSPGSFEINFEVAQSVFQMAVDLFKGDTITAAVNFKEVLFVGAGALFGLIKLLRGRKPNVIATRPDGKAEIEIDGARFEVPLAWLRLLSDKEFREGVHMAIATPLQTAGIDRATVGDGSTRTTVEKADAEAFRAPEQSAPAATTTLEERKEGQYQITALALEGERKWSLRGETGIINAKIADDEFLNRVNRREVIFGAGDKLHCMILMRQEPGKSPEYIIEHVIDHYPGPQQSKMF